MEQDDRNIRILDQSVEITCIFDDLPEELSIDSTAKTTLQAECLLNQNGKLEILKKYNCSNKIAPKEQIFARTYHQSRSPKTGQIEHCKVAL